MFVAGVSARFVLFSAVLFYPFLTSEEPISRRRPPQPRARRGRRAKKKEAL
jgi:hypothetical protein